VFRDDQFILMDWEMQCKCSIRKLKTVNAKYGLKISKSITKIMTFKGRDPEK